MRIKSKETFKFCLIFLAVLFSVKFIYRHLSPGPSRPPYNINQVLSNKAICILPEINPWDPEVLPFLAPDWNPMKKCIAMTKMHTELKNGWLRQLINSTSKCFYRCLYADGENKYAAGDWYSMKINESYQEECDFIETYCSSAFRTTYRYIHSQVLKPEKKFFQREDILHPSVFMLVLDSVSSSSGMRSAPKTLQILRQYFDAVPFYYHNKVGANSRPNAFGMFAGARATALDDIRFANKSSPEIGRSCEEGLNKDETITFDFINLNYATIIAEDWVGAFTWPNCIGYDSAPTDHYTSPLIIRSTYGKDKKDFNKYFYIGKCKDTFHRIVDYAAEFLKIYENISKFAMIWLSNPAHDTVSGIYSIDEFLANFFRNNMKLLDRSFIFLMGDHGARIDPIRSTRIGYLEDNNPMLVIAVPKYLRVNRQLMENLRMNSRKHTSHYDFYATLYDIAHTARQKHFQKWNMRNFTLTVFRQELGDKRGGIRARSLLRPISYNRTCDEMEIPDEYCLCKRLIRNISNENRSVRKYANELVKYMNERIQSYDSGQWCNKLFLADVHLAEQLENWSRIRLVIETTPGHAKIEAEMRKDGTKYEIIPKSINRINKYKEQSHCIKNQTSDIRLFCYCKDQNQKFQNQ
uniref:Uncharacterized protein n=1 Tax=Setaria digitata TaxID=48799 RepID=A0A915PQ34_9BILA